MQVVPIDPLPSQTLQINLGDQACQIAVYTQRGLDLTDPTLQTEQAQLYFDLSYNGIDVTSAAICLNQKRLLINRQYLGFAGDFMFVDTEGESDPQYAGLGSRWLLLYVTPADIAAALANAA